MTNYPRLYSIRCSQPPGYPDENWYYGIWRQERWDLGPDGANGFPKCFDPELCHWNPPSLPTDGTVISSFDVTDEDHLQDLDRSQGSTIVYKCKYKCKFNLAFMQFIWRV